MTKKARFLTLVCALAGCFALYGCSDDKNKDQDNPGPSDAECQQDADCASNAEGKTECDVENHVCVKPTVVETCGNGALDDGEQCDGVQIASDLSLDCGENKKQKESLTCDVKTCKIDLSASCELDPDKAECLDDSMCADKGDKTKCDLDKGVCVEPTIVTPPGPGEYSECEYPDEDGDGISDEIEGKEENRDTDNDTIPDYQDPDSDNDTIPDSLEGGTNGCSGETPKSSGIGDPDYVNSDIDGNGILDGIECCGSDAACKAGLESGGEFTCIDTDVDGVPDYMDDDNDGDGILDLVEIESESADCDGDGVIDPKGDADSPFDCDKDGVPDYMDVDSDGDGILDAVELDGKNNAEFMTRYLTDSDGDTLLDGDEVVKDAHGAKYVCDVTGARMTQDGHDLVEKADDKQIGYYDENGDFVSAGLPEDTKYYYEPISGCADTECKNTIYCYVSKDCDRDGLGDEKEVLCVIGEDVFWSGTKADADGDEYMDASEYAVYDYARKNEVTSVTVGDNTYPVNTAADLICNPNVGVTNIIDFYFELPFVSDEYIAQTIADSKKAAEEHPEQEIDVIEDADEFWEKNPDRLPKDDSLIFKPAVSKLDLVINVDTTSSMTEAIKSVHDNVGDLIKNVQAQVADTGFALTNFDDFPISGYGSGGDLPFRLLGPVSTDPEKVKKYTERADFKVRNGGDLPEAGAESLWQIATGEGIQWSTGSVDVRTNLMNTWGGVDFRPETLPVVVHITDAPSHDISTSYNAFSENIAYTPADVTAPHYSDVLIPKLKELGIRVITLYVGHQDANKYNQMFTWAKESDAIVPLCAFNKMENGEKVEAELCNLGSPQCIDVAEGQPGYCANEKGEKLIETGTHSLEPIVNGESKQCVLFYKGEQKDTITYINQGVDAIVKYGTYDVSTVVRGEPILGIVDKDGNEVEVDTSCFIQKVEAKNYIAPPEWPESECNPKATPQVVGESEYNNGFSNFAPGTSNPEIREGAKLEFQVVAQNFDCVPQTEEVQVFKAYIDVVNPTTGLVFGTREVSIIVPAKPVEAGEEVN